MTDEKQRRDRRAQFAAEKKRQEGLARLAIENRRKASPAVQRRNEQNRRFKELSDIALEASVKGIESVLEQDKGSFDHQQRRQIREDWKDLLEERATRDEERRRIRSEAQMAAAREQQREETLRLNQDLPWHELARKIEALQQERDRLTHEARFDASLRSAASMAAQRLDAAREEKRLRTEGFKRPVRTLDENDHEAGKAFNRAAYREKRRPETGRPREALRRPAARKAQTYTPGNRAGQNVGERSAGYDEKRSEHVRERLALRKDQAREDSGRER